MGIASVRNGEIVSVRNVEIEAKLGEEKNEIIAEFLEREYVDLTPILSTHGEGDNKRVLLTDELISSELEKLLKTFHVTIETPSIGPKRSFLDFTRTNVLNYAHKLELSTIGKRFLTRSTQEQILAQLGYEVPKK